MATKYGANRTLANTPTGQNIIKPGACLGRLRVMTDIYTLTSATDLDYDTNKDVIEMGVPLPKGAHVVDVVMIWEDMADDLYVSVGDAESPARYIPSTDISSAAGLVRIVAAAGASTPYEVDMSETDADNQILVTTTAGTSNNDGAKIILMVYYTQD